MRFWGFRKVSSPMFCFTSIRSPARERSAFPWHFPAFPTSRPGVLPCSKLQQIAFMVPSLHHFPSRASQTAADPSQAHRSQPSLLPCLLGCSMNQWCLCISPSTLSNLPSSAPSSTQSLRAGSWGVLVVKHPKFGSQNLSGRPEVGQRKPAETQGAPPSAGRGLESPLCHQPPPQTGLGFAISIFRQELLCHWRNEWHL